MVLEPEDYPSAMGGILEVLQVLQVFVFGFLGVIALYKWRKGRGAAEAWAAATFGSLALVVVLGRLLPEEEHTALTDLIRRVNVAVVVLFPYLLFRFTATFRPPSWRVELVAGLLTALAVLGPIVLGPPPLPGEPRTVAFQAYIYVVLTQWVVLSVMVAWRLWRGAVAEPSAARRRMRTLGIGAIGLALAIVLAGVAGNQDPNPVQVAVQIIAIASALLFLLGMFPPSVVRKQWRKEEEESLRRAQMQLMEAAHPDEVIEVLLPHVSRLLAGGGAVIVDADGSVRGIDRLTPADAERIAAMVAATGGRAGPSNVGGPRQVLSVPLGSGWLAVEGTSFTPFFGQDETEMMEGLAFLAALALNRAELYQRDRQMNVQLAQAQAVARIGSWEWQLAEDRVTWSDQLFKIFGVAPEDFDGTYQAALAHIHPDDRPLLEAEIANAIETRGHFSVENRIIRPDDQILVIHSEGQVLTGPDGEPARMIGVIQDVTERKRQERYREQFITNAAHELRTPLTSLLGFVEILSTRRDRMNESDLDEAFGVMERAGHRLGSLVNNLLDLTKVQEGHIHLDLMEVPLRPAITDVVQSNPPPEGKELEVHVPDDLKAIADPGRFGQIVLNLVSNAYKYGGSHIVVRARDLDGEVHVEVEDDGPGVEPRLIEHLFEPFRRGETVASITGSGLGLAISKMLVEASGGRIWYDDESRGAHFTLALRRS